MDRARIACCWCTLIVLVSVIIIAPGCASRQPAVKPPAPEYVSAAQQIDQVIDPLKLISVWHYLAVGIWPPTKAALDGFLEEAGAPITLSHYARITMVIDEDDTFHCEYIFSASDAWCKLVGNRVPGSKISGGFSVTAEEALNGDREHVDLEPLLTLPLLLAPEFSSYDEDE